MCTYRTKAKIIAAIINRFAIFLLLHDRRVTDLELEQYRSKQAKVKKYGDKAKSAVLRYVRNLQNQSEINDILSL